MESEQSTVPSSGDAGQNEGGASVYGADVVNIHQGGAQKVSGNTVTVRQGGMQQVTGEHLTVRQGGVLKAKVNDLHIVSGGAGLVQTERAELVASNAGVVIAGGAVTLDQGSARILVAGGPVTVDQGATALMVANNVNAQNSAILFLFAKNVEGDVKPAFGPKETLLFGSVAGLVAGVLLMLSSMFRRKKRK